MMMWSCYVLLALSVVSAEEYGSCFAAPKGKNFLSTYTNLLIDKKNFSDVYPTDKSTHLVEHSLQYTKAVISKAAPIFSGTAVVNGEFKTISLNDFLGKYVVFFFYPLDFTFGNYFSTPFKLEL